MSITDFDIENLLFSEEKLNSKFFKTKKSKKSNLSKFF